MSSPSLSPRGDGDYVGTPPISSGADAALIPTPSATPAAAALSLSTMSSRPRKRVAAVACMGTAVVLTFVYLVGVAHVPCTARVSVSAFARDATLLALSPQSEDFVKFDAVVTPAVNDAIWLINFIASSATLMHQYCASTSNCSSSASFDGSDGMSIANSSNTSAFRAVCLSIPNASLAAVTPSCAQLVSARRRTSCRVPAAAALPQITTGTPRSTVNGTSCAFLGVPDIPGIVAAALSTDGLQSVTCVGGTAMCDIVLSAIDLIRGRMRENVQPASVVSISSFVVATGDYVLTGVLHCTPIGGVMFDVIAVSSIRPVSAVGSAQGCDTFLSDLEAGFEIIALLLIVVLSFAVGTVTYALVEADLSRSTALVTPQVSGSMSGSHGASGIVEIVASANGNASGNNNFDRSGNDLIQMEALDEDEDADDVTKPLVCVRGTAVYVVSLGFLARSGPEAANADQTAAQFLTDVATSAASCEGHVSFRSACAALVTFNGATPVVEHEKNAVAFADTMRSKESCRSAVMALSSGGIAFNPNTAPAIVSGPCIDDVLALHTLQVELEVPIVLSEHIAYGGSAAGSLRTRAVPLDVVSIDGRAPMMIFEMLPGNYGGDIDALRNVVSLMSKARFDHALQLLGSLQKDEFVIRILRRCYALRHSDKAYCRSFVGWHFPPSREHDGDTSGDDDQEDATPRASTTAFASLNVASSFETATDMTTGSSATSTKGTSTQGTTISGLVDSIALEYDGLPYEFVDLRNKRWLRSDKRIGNTFGIPLYAGMAEEGTPVAIWACDLRDASVPPDFEASLLQHVSITSGLDHASVVKVQCASVINNRWLLLVEESLPGGDLQWLLREFAPLHVDTIRRLCRELLDGLRYLHHRRIAHCGLSWYSVRLAMDGALHMCWFASSVQLNMGGRESTSTPKVRPTGPFLAPEIRASMPAHPCTDMFSFGAILLTMIVGSLPASFDLDGGCDVRELLATSAVPAVHRADLSDLVSACLRIDPTSRPTPNEAALHRFFASQ